MKSFYLTIFLLCTFVCQAQKTIHEKFNKVTSDELRMKVYDKDTTAHAVVLEEYGETYFDVLYDRIYLIKHFYAKIKIIDKQGLAYADIKIPFYKNGKSVEQIVDISAITHNSDQIDYLEKDQIFSVDLSNYYSEKRFTFPNAKPGSVLEYRYTLQSPFIYNFEGWDFQADIPKVYSEFNARIPANYRYNRTLKGFQELAINEASVEKRCFEIQEFRDKADCELLRYAMKDIPAFKEEAFMLSKNNYISRIAFEMSELIRFDGTKEAFTKTWKAVDTDMRKDKDIGAQVRKNNYFKNQLPETILNESSELKKAQKIYNFIKNHYTWNGEYGLFRDANVRQAFQNESGNVAEINISLINSLLAADLKTETVMLSTRAKGLPTQKHPVMSDFNYLIAKVTIDGKEYLLDATDKFLSFGLLPIRALNYNGRAMDFKNPSYWYTISPTSENRQNTTIRITVNEDGEAKGQIAQVHTGYLGYEKRKDLDEIDEDKYLDNLEKKLTFLEIDEYKTKNKSDVDKPITESFSFSFNEGAFAGKETFLDPFLKKVLASNPFQLNERQYPVDFAYPRIYTTRFLMSIPDNFSYKNLPENQEFTLAGGKAVYAINVTQQGGQLNVYFQLVIGGYYYEPEEYQALKEFFGKVATLQSNTRIVIQKK